VVVEEEAGEGVANVRARARERERAKVKRVGCVGARNHAEAEEGGDTKNTVIKYNT
jgi:hypothetical protein